MNDFKETTRSLKDRVVLIRILKYLRPYLGKFFFAVGLMAIGVGIALVPPFLIGNMIDTLTSGENTTSYKIWYVIILSSIYLVLLIIANILSYIQSITLQIIGQKVVFKLREEVFVHIENLSIGQFNSVPVGKLMTRVCNDTNALGELFTSVFANLIRAIIYFFAIVVVLLLINVQMALMVFILVPIAFVGTFVYRYFTQRTYRKIRNNISELNAYLAENLSGVKVTQIFAKEDKVAKGFDVKNRQARRNWLQLLTNFAIYRPFISLVSAAGTLITFYFGAQQALAGVITSGLIVSFFFYLGDFFRPIEEISDLYNAIQDGFTSAEKIFDVLDTKPAIIDPDDAVELTTFTGHIEFKNVWFSYHENEWILKDVSFVVKPNETVAFVGATGSGKTTILALIVRNYEIQKGQILLDGIDINTIKRSSIRKHIGQMLQDVFLFNATIYENISLFDESIPKTTVLEAIKYVGADKFIEKLPGNINHMVLERGNNFSVGQRQLISFARAITYKPSLMILDEATANIDSETEGIIQESLQKMMNINTMLIVAHRLSTIQHANKIIVMHKGEVKETGNHQELLKRRGLYYTLYELQIDRRLLK